MSDLDALDSQYPVILCDIWGCIHDGVQLYLGAAERLRRWCDSRRTVILITNAPRTAEAVTRQLETLGLDDALWDGIATSGDAGIACLRTARRPVGFIGTEADRAILESRGVRIAASDEFEEIACAGLDETRRSVADYQAEIAPLAERGVLMHCLNPDRVVVRGGTVEPCAGAIADRYLEMGGKVEFYGKPYPAIYQHAMRMAGQPQADAVLAIGDGLDTDVLGAARMGFACVYVSGGIAQGRPIPEDFARRNGLGDWRPVAIVEGLH